MGSIIEQLLSIIGFIVEKLVLTFGAQLTRILLLSISVGIGLYIWRRIFYRIGDSGLQEFSSFTAMISALIFERFILGSIAAVCGLVAGYLWLAQFACDVPFVQFGADGKQKGEWDFSIRNLIESDGTAERDGVVFQKVVIREGESKGAQGWANKSKLDEVRSRIACK
jgi:hypothetical protein